MKKILVILLLAISLPIFSLDLNVAKRVLDADQQALIQMQQQVVITERSLQADKDDVFYRELKTKRALAVNTKNKINFDIAVVSNVIKSKSQSNTDATEDISKKESLVADLKRAVSEVESITKEIEQFIKDVENRPPQGINR
jgi:predicted  nucleic acid-binding Zn-ribbon protein